MKALSIIRRVLALAVAIWALALIVLYLFFGKISFKSSTTTGIPGQPSVTATTTGQLPWLSQAQPISIAFMLAFSLLLMAAAMALWRASLAFSIPLTLFALVFTFITGFSIGSLYFPGAVAAFLGVLLLAVGKIANRPELPIA